jgi:hypothetical protein
VQGQLDLVANSDGSLLLAPAENIWGDWQAHRYQNVEEPVLAEALIWELLGYPLPNGREPISIDLHIAEQAFRDLHYRLRSEIALAEKAKE